MTSRERMMREIWSEVFCDTDDYISLLFDNYYCPESTRIALDGKKVIASMFLLGYEFKGESIEMQGMYLSGLATRPDYRRRGIMSEMINSVIEEAKIDKKVNLLFLIPADDKLREYYEKFGFKNSADILEVNVVDSVNEKCKIALDKNTYISNKKTLSIIHNKCRFEDKRRIVTFNDFEYISADTNLRKSIVNIIQYKNIKDAYFDNEIVIFHSEKDIEIYIKEKLNDGGELWILIDDESNISALICLDSSRRIWWLGGEIDDFILLFSIKLKSELKEASSNPIVADNQKFDPSDKSCFKIMLTTLREKKLFRDYAASEKNQFEFYFSEKHYGMVLNLNIPGGGTNQDSKEILLQNWNPKNIAFKLMLD